MVQLGSRGYREEMEWNFVGTKRSRLLFTISHEWKLEDASVESVDTRMIVTPHWIN